MAAATLMVSAISIVSLYRTAINQHSLRLVEIVDSQARLIEAIAKFDSQYSDNDYPKGARAATLDQVAAAHREFKGFGETGEFTLARRDGEQIVFVLSRRHAQSQPRRYR